MNTIDNAAAGTSERRSGRKRAVVAAGALLGVAALATGAAFTDFGLLNINGGGADGGLGGADNRYNIQVSAGQENTVDSVAAWIEANPDAADVAPVAGADSLVPGGAPIYVKLPVRNDSPTFSSKLSLAFEDVTGAAATPEQEARNKAYAGLLRVDIAEVDDASAEPAAWTASKLDIKDGHTAAADLHQLDPKAGKVVVAKVYLLDGADQAATNAANGGTVKLQARFDGSSIN